MSETEQAANFLDIAREIERRAGAWCFMATEGPEGEGEEWTCGSTLPDRAAEAIRQQGKYLELAQQAIEEERGRAEGLKLALIRIARNSDDKWARDFAQTAVSADKLNGPSALEAERAIFTRLIEALRYYADPIHYEYGDVPGHIYVLDDGGRYAREAIGHAEPE